MDAVNARSVFFSPLYLEGWKGRERGYEPREGEINNKYEKNVYNQKVVIKINVIGIPSSVGSSKLATIEIATNQRQILDYKRELANPDWTTTINKKICAEAWAGMW